MAQGRRLSHGLCLRHHECSPYQSPDMLRHAASHQQSTQEIRISCDSMISEVLQIVSDGRQLLDTRHLLRFNHMILSSPDKQPAYACSTGSSPSSGSSPRGGSGCPSRSSAWRTWMVSCRAIGTVAAFDPSARLLDHALRVWDRAGVDPGVVRGRGVSDGGVHGPQRGPSRAR